MDGRVTVLSTGVPVYALSFAGSKHLFYVGGGGAGKSGVTNNIKCAEAQTRNGADLCAAGDLTLRTDEDAPMCISVHPNDSMLACGINEAAAKIKEQNRHLRTFNYEVVARPAARADGAAENSVRIHPSSSYASLGIDDVDHYQKAIAFSPDGALLAVASSDGRIQLHRYPDMEPIWSQPYEVEGRQEVYDLDFSHDGTQLVCTTGQRLYILSTAPKTSENSNLVAFSARLLQSIDTVTIGSENGVLRAAKFGRGKPDVGTRDRLYALINVAPSKRSKVRSSYLAMWNADTWSLKLSRKVANRPATVMSLSPNGRMIAVGTSDLSITLFQARTLRMLYRAEKVHDFPPTCLMFSPNSCAIASGSADSTLRLEVLPEGLMPKLSITDEAIFVLFFITAILLAILVLRIRE